MPGSRHWISFLCRARTSTGGIRTRRLEGGHGGFLRTGETASFIIAEDDVAPRWDVQSLFGQEHRFYKKDILRLEDMGEGEPLLSEQLRAARRGIQAGLLHGVPRQARHHGIGM